MEYDIFHNLTIKFDAYKVLFIKEHTLTMRAGEQNEGQFIFGIVEVQIEWGRSAEIHRV